MVRARIDGLSHAEISRRFGIFQRASLSRLYRARKKLADHLKELCSIFGLVRILRLKEIISGGVVAMKIGIGAKVTINFTYAHTSKGVVVHYPSEFSKLTIDRTVQ